MTDSAGQYREEPNGEVWKCTQSGDPGRWELVENPRMELAKRALAGISLEFTAKGRFVRIGCANDDEANAICDYLNAEKRKVMELTT